MDARATCEAFASAVEAYANLLQLTLCPSASWPVPAIVSSGASDIARVCAHRNPGGMPSSCISAEQYKFVMHITVARIVPAMADRVWELTMAPGSDMPFDIGSKLLDLQGYIPPQMLENLLLLLETNEMHSEAAFNDWDTRLVALKRLLKTLERLRQLFEDSSHLFQTSHFQPMTQSKTPSPSHGARQEAPLHADVGLYSLFPAAPVDHRPDDHMRCQQQVVGSPTTPQAATRPPSFFSSGSMNDKMWIRGSVTRDVDNMQPSLATHDNMLGGGYADYPRKMNQSYTASALSTGSATTTAKPSAYPTPSPDKNVSSIETLLARSRLDSPTFTRTERLEPRSSIQPSSVVDPQWPDLPSDKHRAQPERGTVVQLSSSSQTSAKSSASPGPSRAISSTQQAPAETKEIQFLEAPVRYKTAICKRVEHGITCKYKQDCGFAHSELQKAAYMKLYLACVGCPDLPDCRDKTCQHAHTRAEQEVALKAYKKTVEEGRRGKPLLKHTEKDEFDY